MYDWVKYDWSSRRLPSNSTAASLFLGSNETDVVPPTVSFLLFQVPIDRIQIKMKPGGVLLANAAHFGHDFV
jgi:hypothetical protein